MRKNNSGFTLVEVLAVIVILGLIMIIAMPTYSVVYNSLKHTTYLNKLKTLNVAAQSFGSNTQILDEVKAKYDLGGSNWCKDVAIRDLIRAGYIVSDDDVDDVIRDIYTGKPIGYNSFHLSDKEYSSVSLCYCSDTFDVVSYLIKDLGKDMDYFEDETIRVFVEKNVNGEKLSIPQYRTVTEPFNYDTVFNSIRTRARNGGSNVTTEGVEIDFGNTFDGFTEEQFNNDDYVKPYIDKLIALYFSVAAPCNLVK